MADRHLPSYDVTELVSFAERRDGSMEVVPRYTGPLEPPNAWWAEWDKALHHALSQGWEPRKAEDFANEMAELTHPGGRNS